MREKDKAGIYQDVEEGMFEGSEGRPMQEAVNAQSRAVWVRFLSHQDTIGIFLTIGMLAILWFTFHICKLCVLGVFIVSSLLCMRLPYLQIVFWPSLLVLILNMHVLRGIHINVDVPVGESIDNMWRTT